MGNKVKIGLLGAGRIGKLHGENLAHAVPNYGFSREMSKALVNRIVVDADESKTCITLDVFLTAGRESCTDSVLPAAQSSDVPLKLTFPRPRSGHQGGYEVTYLVRWHLD